jgi:hypothetical protein
MTHTLIEITEDDFNTRYPLRTNHLNPHASWASGEAGGCLFETFGEELDFVRRQDPATVWTLVDGEDGDQYLLSGIHLVNRLGYLVSLTPVPEGVDIQVRIPLQSEESEAATACTEQARSITQHTPGPWDYDMDYIVAPDPNGRHPDIYIAEIADSDDEGRVATIEQQDANRRLIAAAPELLKALRASARALSDIVAAAANDDPYSPRELIDRFWKDCEAAQTVLTKATADGRSV